MNSARWSTMANRILRLYVSTDNLSEILGYWAEVVMNVYIPTWIDIKINWKAKEAAVIYYQMIRRVNDLENQKDREISSRSMQRNSYFYHPENIIIAMICDKNLVQKQLG